MTDQPISKAVRVKRAWFWPPVAIGAVALSLTSWQQFPERLISLMLFYWGSLGLWRLLIREIRNGEE